MIPEWKSYNVRGFVLHKGAASFVSQMAAEGRHHNCSCYLWMVCEVSWWFIHTSLSAGKLLVENNQPVNLLSHELLNTVLIKIHIKLFWVMTPFTVDGHMYLQHQRKDDINYFMTPQRMLRFSDTKHLIKWLCMAKGLYSKKLFTISSYLSRLFNGTVWEKSWKSSVKLANVLIQTPWLLMHMGDKIHRKTDSQADRQTELLLWQSFFMTLYM